MNQHRTTKQHTSPSRLVIVGENDHDPLKETNNTNVTNIKNKVNDIHIATMNCRSLRTHEKRQELELAIEELKWDIIGISEMRRFGEGIENHGKYVLHYKGETPGMYGVGFMVKINLVNNIEELRGISERIAILNIKLSLNGEKEERWSIIQAYSPTESDKKEDVKTIENFYEDLQNAIYNAHKNVIVMGDFNGQIGIQNSGEENIIGNYGYGNRSKNGKRLVNFALENRLSILNSFYKRKPSKKWTWISPNGQHKNEIDFIMSNNRKAFKNVSIINNLNFNTDHRMVRATMSGMLKKTRRFHSDHIAVKYTGDPKLLLNNLQTSLDTMELHKKEYPCIQEKYNLLLKQLKTITRETNKNVKKEVSLTIKQLMQERKELLKQKKYKGIRQRITEVSKKISEQLRKERKTKRSNTMKSYIEKTGGIKKAMKELNYKKDWIPSMKKKDGNSTSKRLDILKIATRYYQNLYQSQKEKETIRENDEITDEEHIPEIMKVETIKAINTQKLDKTPGSDLVTNELLKVTLPVIAPKLTDIFNEIIITENIPEDWTKSTIILLHKKGDKGDISNYRPISLMSNVYKVFSKIILSRITNILEANQPKEQAGFRRNFSTIDHIHVLRQILQKTKEYNKTFYIAFVDFNKAFDTLEHKFIWDALERQGVHGKYIRILKNVYKKSTAQIKLESIGEEFPVERGVRQGDPISPKIFSAVLEMIFRNLNWKNKGLNINGENLSHLRFADDLILFSENPKTLETMLQELATESEKAGLSMNLMKTKVMTNSSQTEPITVNNEEIGYVREYVYLGQLVSTEGCMEKEIERRIANTWKRYWSLSEIMKNKDMSMRNKRRVYNMCILPCLLYGCQTWALTEELARKIKICQNGIERSTIGAKRKDRVKLKCIKNKTKFKNAYITYRCLKWRWAGHMIREEREKWTRLITEWQPRGSKRNRGRQSRRWEDDIIKIAGPVWTRIAKDRIEWKSLEEAYVGRQATT